ncbi:hypothetical protein ABZ330_35070 [Streptomyces sp. NPDC006172]|uniref:HflX-like GTP-binding protein n=1 Tax=Streptomyces sp. NPDC006172 TaxID=3154470 RepID=UPI0033CC11CA
MHQLRRRDRRLARRVPSEPPAQRRAFRLTAVGADVVLVGYFSAKQKDFETLMASYGKVREVAQACDQANAEVVIFVASLTERQQRVLTDIRASRSCATTTRHNRQPQNWQRTALGSCPARITAPSARAARSPRTRCPGGCLMRH